MLEQDPAKITVQLVQFEKYVPFCVPGAEGTFGIALVVTSLRTGDRTVVAVPLGQNETPSTFPATLSRSHAPEPMHVSTRARSAPVDRAAS